MGQITRDNVDLLLNAGMIEIAMKNGNWWKIRRNGQTKRWKKDPNRLYIPIKFGFKGYGNITETDFIDGELNTAFYRVRKEEE